MVVVAIGQDPHVHGAADAAEPAQAALGGLERHTMTTMMLLVVVLLLLMVEIDIVVIIVYV